SQIRRDIISGIYSRSDFKSTRRENVTSFAIIIFDESNARGAIRVVLNSHHFRCDTVLTPLKIDFAVLMFVTAADVSRLDPTVVMPTAALLLRLKKALFRAPLRNRIESR